MTGRMFTFIGGVKGPWRILRTDAVIGESLPESPRAEIVDSLVASAPPGALWLLRGVTSNERYVTRGERQRLGGETARAWSVGSCPCGANPDPKVGRVVGAHSGREAGDI